MLRSLLLRIVHAVLSLVLLSLLVFLLSRAMPGDIWTELQMDPSISPATIKELRDSYGLNRPEPIQYLLWLEQVLHGNLGYSAVEKQAVAPLLWQRLSRTVALATTTMVITFVATLILCFPVFQRRWQQRWLDSKLIPMLLAFPVVLTCLFVNWVHIVIFPPVYGQEFGSMGYMLERLFWPSLALSIPLTAFLSKQMRNETRQILRMQYFMIARSKGLPIPGLLRNGLKPAIPVFLNLTGFLFTSLMGGTVVAETVFDIPGIGLLTWHAMLNRDTLLLVAGVLAGCSLVILGNLAVDLLTIWADPRLRKPIQ
ncbi:MAG: ABC transporter permease [Acidobacteria bacterium]|nr:ABC transporter permease [Acidobacteriota bacterium]